MTVAIPIEQLANKYGGKTGRSGAREPSKWAKHHFIVYDGEGCNIKGRHQYIYMAAYDGAKFYSIRDDTGLGTEVCFRFLIDTSTTSKYSINVIYGGSYDSNMMLQDVSLGCLKQLHAEGFTKWREWTIRYVGRKFLQVTHVPSKRTCQLWDVIGFYQSSFEVSLSKWLNVKDEVIAKGKKSRSSFNIKNIEFVMAYCNTELQYFYELQMKLYESLVNAGIKLNRWDGAGAIASSLFHQYGMVAFKGSQEEQDKHYLKARSAYAGGRFELVRPGDYREPVYNYDINSAYPFAITQLPPFTKLVKRKSLKAWSEYISDYDLCYITYRGNYQDNIHPFFHRDRRHRISYPWNRDGWCWGVEINTARELGFLVDVEEIWHWVDDGSRPWSWIADLYAKRLVLKQAGDNAEKVLKLGINSLYGKTVQQRGWHPGDDIPTTHQLYWGGWTTAKTRSMMFAAMMQHPEAIVAVETDGIFTTAKLDLELGDGLGQWDYKTYDDLTYVQSGMYFGTLHGQDIARYRGLDKGTLTREKLLEGWESFWNGKGKGKTHIEAKSTRFRTLGTSLAGERMVDWCQWKREDKSIALLPDGKRRHDPNCHEPWGRGHHHTTLAVQPQEYETVPYNVLWAGDHEDKLALYEQIEADWEGVIVEN